MILQRDQLRGPVRVTQGIECKVRGDARAALRTGEELEQDDAVMMGIGAARVRIWFEGFKIAPSSPRPASASVAAVALPLL